MARIFSQAGQLEGRNGNIWLARASGASAAQIADEYGLSESRVYVIIKQVAASIPAGDRDELRKAAAEFYDRMRQDLLEIALADPKPSFAASGKELTDRNGEPIPDNSERLAAYDRLLKLAAQYAKLVGIDAPDQLSVNTSGWDAQANQEAVDAILARFPVSAPVLVSGQG